MTVITVILDDEVNDERVTVNLDSTIPVSQVIDALVQLRQLPKGDYDSPRTYQLIRITTDVPLRPDMSLAAQGVFQNEELALAEITAGVGIDTRILMGLGALGLVAILAVVILLISTLVRANQADPVPTETPTPLATETPDLTATALVASPTATLDLEVTDEDPGSARGCEDSLAFVDDITVPDGTEFAPGETFSKTWRVENSGTCEWTSNYQWFFVLGDQMGGPSNQILGQTAPSGAQIDITVGLVAPLEPGTYLGYWQLQNSEGERFGPTPYVEIVVIGPTPEPADVTVSAEPEEATSITDIVTVRAESSRTVPLLVMLFTGVENENLGTHSCANTDNCFYEFGGNDNEYGGTVTVTVLACESDDNCGAENNLGNANTTFSMGEELTTPTRLVIASFEDNSGGTGYTVSLVWGSVVDADTYEIYYQFDNGDLTLSGESNVTSYDFEILDTTSDFPVTLSIRACNQYVCSDFVTVVQEVAP